MSSLSKTQPEGESGLAWPAEDETLLPAIVQDAETLQVLMLGYMNREAFDATLRDGLVTFFSRSKGRLWTKGESSGNTLALVDVQLDCDQDALLVRALPAGPTCHRETTSCFGDERAPGLGFLARLERVIATRKSEAPKGSYTTELFADGLERIAQKVGEEGVETVVALLRQGDGALKGEVADLVFHVLVGLQARGLSLADVVEELRVRHRG